MHEVQARMIASQPATLGVSAMQNRVELDATNTSIVGTTLAPRTNIADQLWNEAWQHACRLLGLPSHSPHKVPLSQVFKLPAPPTPPSPPPPILPPSQSPSIAHIGAGRATKVSLALRGPEHHSDDAVARRWWRFLYMLEGFVVWRKQPQTHSDHDNVQSGAHARRLLWVDPWLSHASTKLLRQASFARIDVKAALSWIASSTAGCNSTSGRHVADQYAH